MSKWVYNFGFGKADGNSKMRNVLGGKGANLFEMDSLGAFSRQPRAHDCTTIANSGPSNGMIVWHSGSPKRILYSISLGSDLLIIRPAYNIPL